MRPIAVGALYKEYLSFAFIVIMVYSNYLYFIPRYFQKGKIKLFWLFAISTILLAALGEFMLVKPNIYYCIVRSLKPDEIDKYFRAILFLIIFRDLCFFLFFFLHKIYKDLSEKYLYEQHILSQKTKSIIITQPERKKYCEIYIQDIAYVSQNRNITSFHLINGTAINQYFSLSQVEQLLPENTCLRINKTNVVMLSQIMSYNESTIVLKLKENDEHVQLPISEKYLKDLLHSYNKYNKLRDKVNTKDMANSSNGENKLEVKKVADDKSKLEDLREIKLRPTAKEILLFIKNNPGCKVKDISKKVNWTDKTVEYHVKNLKKYKLIEYKGDLRTGGYYAVKQKNIN
ncbi:LytTR family transcriptional regulator DNA-binding domain-containing protein [Bacteroidales bacterium OttesenSCG-928-K22]|nr:LytTR family transcriptional regulator DNA-binding domain-containing protein [Bacteroidales bacterium OttesenSCG-928-K22]